jgi:Adenylate and Guanylate cyclase catalytic domain
MSGLSASGLADLAGVTVVEVQRLVELGVLAAREGPGSFRETDVPKVRLAVACERAGLPMEGIAAAVRSGRLSSAFLETALYRRWAVRSGPTYRQVSQDTGVPVELLASALEAMGFTFREPAGAVVSALDLVGQLPEAGLPPAHVGVVAGPVVIQGGDYFGRTVNLAARIAARAGPDQVLVSQRVADSAPPEGVRFVERGELPLKGFARPVRLLEARRA